MIAFDIEGEQENTTQTIRNASAIHQRLGSAINNKFSLTTYTKGFFHTDILYDHEQPLTQNSSLRKERQKSSNPQSARKRTKRAHSITLQPFKQTNTISVFQNRHNKPEPKEIQLNLDHMEDTVKAIPSYETRRMAKKRLSKTRKQASPIQFEQPKLQVKQIQNLLFFREQVEQPKANKDIQLPSDLKDEEQQPELKINESELSTCPNQLIAELQQKYYQPPQEQRLFIACSDYFNYHSLKQFKKQLIEQTKKENLLRFTLTRDKDGLNTFWPEFHLHFQESNKYVMSAKKTSSKPTSTFILSASQTVFSQKSQQYLGKIKSNLLGDVLNVFGPGLNPSNAKQNYQIPRELIATIVYKSRFFDNEGPREFKVFILKQQYRYYSNFPQVVMYKDEIPLNLLYEIPQNKEKIKVYYNRKPVWSESMGGYKLNFKGRVETPSNKNFILQERIIGPDVTIFGKVSQQKFNLDVYHPIPPLVAFATALSSFDTRC